MDKDSIKYETRALVTFAVLLFVITELVVIAALWNVPDGHLNLGIFTKYVLPFVVSLPMIAGIKGYFTVKRRMLSTNYDTLGTLSRQFLTTITVAYAAIIFLVSALQQ